MRLCDLGWRPRTSHKFFSVTRFPQNERAPQHVPPNSRLCVPVCLCIFVSVHLAGRMLTDPKCSSSSPATLETITPACQSEDALRDLSYVQKHPSFRVLFVVGVLIIIEMFELRQINSHLNAYHVQFQRPIRLCIIVNNLQMDRVHIHLRA